MNYIVKVLDVILGTSKLESKDLSMGIVHGDFIPEQGYEKFKEVFLLFAEERYEEYYRKRDSLNLSLEDQSGVYIDTDYIHIEDFLREYNEINLEIKLSNLEYFERKIST